MMNSKTALLLSLSALCSLQTALAFAQAGGGAEIELDKLVITASRSETRLKDMPSDVSVIRRADVEQANALTLDDLLNRAMPVPDANAFYPMRGSKERHLNMRGLGGGPFMRTRVLLDGMPLNEPHRNFVDWNLIPLDALDRVEILEGPLSSLYGSGAIGGVINLVTKSPQKASETSAKGSYGSLNTFNSSLVQAGQVGKFSYLVSGQDYQTDSYVAEQLPASYNTPRARRSWNVYSKFGYQASDALSLGFLFLHGTDENNRGTPYNKVNSNNNMGQISCTGQGEKLSWSSRFHLRLDAFTNANDAAPSYNRVDTIQNTMVHDIGGDGNATYQLLDNAKFTLGMEGARNSTALDTQYQTSSRHQTTLGRQAYAGVFGQAEVKWLEEKLIATLGGRGDWYKNYHGSFEDTQGSVNTIYSDHEFSAFSPRLGLLYHLTDNVALRGSGGKSFRAPCFIFLYGDNRQGAATISGNPLLSSESVWMYDVGTDVKLGRGSLAKLTFYQGWSDDFFTQQNLNTAGTLKTFANASAVKLLGFTAEVDYLLTDQWSLKTGYAFQYSKVTDNPTPSDAHRFLVDVPRNKVLMGVGYDNASIVSADATARYKDIAFADTANALTTTSYWCFDLGLWRKIGKFVTARLDVQNVFNHKYQSPGGPIGLTQDPGRFFLGTIRAAF